MTIRTVIHTEEPGVLLRELIPEDAEILFTLIDKNRTYLTRWESEIGKSWPDLAYGIWHGAKLVGYISLAHIDDTSAQIGYWIASQSTHKGYATAAAKTLTELALTHFGYRELVAFAHEWNSAGQMVLVRCGFQFDMNYRYGHTLRFTLKPEETQAASE